MGTTNLRSGHSDNLIEFGVRWPKNNIYFERFSRTKRAVLIEFKIASEQSKLIEACTEERLLFVIASLRRALRSLSFLN